jgi:hypothetical protein
MMIDWRQDLETWPAELREEWEERAAIIEESGAPRKISEYLAWDQMREP